MNITIRKTKKDDLGQLQSLWNEGEVMKYVGFPHGLRMTFEEMTLWYERLSQKEYTTHYCIFEEDLGFVGETFFSLVKDHEIAMLDIKLLEKARGKNIAYTALSYAIDQAFDSTPAKKVYVDPNPENIPAWKLYLRLGFESKPRPDFLEPFEVYLECDKESWKKS
jgi:RimJ/RimL family protein N-acetyltransferase